MLKVLATLLLLSLTCSFKITQIPSKPYILISSRNDMLGFDDFSGPGIHNKMINEFTALAKNASLLFSADPYQHAQYIKTGMDADFGSSSENFFVMIQTERTNSSYYVWITDKKVYASLSGINPAQPTWSYLFVKIEAPKASSSYVFIEHGQIGMGITPELDTYMNRIIDRFEPSLSVCQCSENAIMGIGNALNTGLNQAWSSICGSIGATHSLVNTVDGLWISKQRNKCEYTFYVHTRI